MSPAEILDTLRGLSSVGVRITTAEVQSDEGIGEEDTGHEAGEPKRPSNGMTLRPMTTTTSWIMPPNDPPRLPGRCSLSGRHTALSMDAMP